MTGTEPMDEARRLLKAWLSLVPPASMRSAVCRWLSANPDNNTPGARSNATIGQGNDRAEASYGKTGSATLPTGANPETNKPIAGVMEGIDWDAPEPITLAKVCEWRAEADKLLHETMEGPYSVIVALCDHILASNPEKPAAGVTEPYQVEADGSGHYWDVVYQPTDTAIGTTFGEESDAYETALMLNAAYQRGLASASPAAQDRIPEGIVLLSRVMNGQMLNAGINALANPKKTAAETVGRMWLDILAAAPAVVPPKEPGNG